MNSFVMGGRAFASRWDSPVMCACRQHDTDTEEALLLGGDGQEETSASANGGGESAAAAIWGKSFVLLWKKQGIFHLVVCLTMPGNDF